MRRVSYLCNYGSRLKGLRQGGVVIHVAYMENSGVFDSRTGSETVDSFPSTFCRGDQSLRSLSLLAVAIPLLMWFVISASTFGFCVTCGLSVLYDKIL